MKPEKLSDKLYLATPVLLIASFYFSFISFIAFVPLFLSLEKKKPLHLSFACFFPFLLFIYSGVFKSLYVYYGLSFPLAVFLYLMLILYHFLYLFLPIKITRKLSLGVFFLPFILVAFEILKDKLFYGLPVGDFSMLAYNMPYLVRTSSLFGSSFVTLEILAVNLALYGLILKKYRYGLILLAVMFFVFLPAGSVKIKGFRKIALVQGNIPQSQKWDERYLERNLDIYLKETKRLNAGLVFWPESAYPYLFERLSNNPLIKLSDRRTLIAGVIRKSGSHYYNSVVMVEKGRVEFYNKQILVPFAEFIPMRSILGRFIPGVFDPGDFSKGKGGVIFRYKDLAIAPMICYEEAFGSISRHYRLKGANLLAVLTNDAWFDGTPTFYMLHRNAIYRAAENRIWLVRVANTGVTEVISPRGKIVALLPVDKRASLIFRMPVEESALTIYDMFGYLFAYILVLSVICVIFYRAYKLRREAG